MPIHPSAYVHPRADIDPTVEVGPNCIIEANVRVGPGCRLYHNVFLTGWTQIGEGCTLHPGVIVGHEPQDVKYKGERTYCRVGNRCILREYVTIHRGTVTESTTTVGDDGFFLAGSHIGHNCTVGNRVTLINNTLLAGHVEIGDRVTIGGSSAIHQFVRVGELCMLQGCTGLGMDVPPFMMTDRMGRVAGLNRVGLRRAEIPPADRAEIRAFFGLLYRSGLPFAEAVRQIVAAAQTPSGKKLVAFMQAPSKRGFAGPASRGGRNPAELEE